LGRRAAASGQRNALTLPKNEEPKIERGWKKFRPRFFCFALFNKIDVDFNFIELYKVKK
jgi:hypothetical protein